MKNYISIKSYSPFRREYIYVDVPEYYADQLLIEHRVHIRFGDEFAHPEFGYRLITCFVRRWERKAFETAMNELIDKMTENGKSDYLNFCDKLFSRFK